MQFFAPWAFALAALLPVILALYFLKLRRDERTIASTYLWQQMVRDVAANAPWQRLRPSWLLLLQFLFMAALIAALARPFTWGAAAGGGHLILVVDTSASMAANDVAPHRLGAAAQAARRLADHLPADAPVTLLAAGQSVQAVLSASTDRARLSAALDGLRPGPGSADVATALELAAALAASDPEAQIAVISDGGVRLPPRLSATAPVRAITVGQAAENQAISALSLDPAVAGQGFDAFLRLANHGQQPVERRLLLWTYTASPADGPGHLAAARDLTVPAGGSLALTIPDLPANVVAVEARLEGQDHLALDDRAWAVAPSQAGLDVQVVGPGNRFLETALALIPGAQVTTVPLEDYEAAWAAGPPAAGGPAWLTIFDGVLPSEERYPPGALLFVGPLRSSAFFSVTGSLELPLPLPATSSEPLLRHVDLRDVAVRQAARLALPPWGRAVIVADPADGQSAAPLLAVGEEGGRRLAVLAFDLRHSDLPLRVAFPLLLANLVDALAPGAAGALPPQASPGQPLAIPLPPQAEAALLVGPDGSRQWLPVEGGQALFAGAQALGLYEAAWEANGVSAPLGRFAVNLFSAQESAIQPQPLPGLAGAASPDAQGQEPQRREWWRPLAWLALALLLAEWLVQYRDRWARGRAWLAQRLPTRPSARGA
ncbi:MAG: VWA domain-containing protein [Chloroflexi bacterium]|nr:VWA domain-containing protein [Chloroflexota bacterium]